MNLHNIVAGAVAAINPMLLATIQPSTGFTTDSASFKQVPSYGPPVNILAQVQPLQYKDLLQTNSLTIQGRRVAMYITGDYAANVRAGEKGGDLVSLPDGSKWLVAMELERWSPTSGWVKVACTLQVL